MVEEALSHEVDRRRGNTRSKQNVVVHELSYNVQKKKKRLHVHLFL